MAIRFDDRIETNVAGDVLITGEQIAVSDDNSIIKIGTDKTIGIYTNSGAYNFILTSTNIKTVNELPKAIDKVEKSIINLTTQVIKPALENFKSNHLNINTNERFFGSTLITSTSELNNYLFNIREGDNILPLITLLSAPIKLSTQLIDEGLYYSTKSNAYYGTNLTSIPKDTLICIISTNNVREESYTYGDSTIKMGVLDSNIQILSMPISADSIHNNFETRIANIESLLALK